MASDSVSIREMRIDDYDAIVGLWQRSGLTFRQAGRDSLDSFKRQLETQGTLMHVAEQDGEIVGVAVGSHDSRKGWINRLAVEPSQRNKGVASALVKALEDGFREFGLPVYSALISSGNKGSISLFNGLGYSCDEDVKYFSKRLGDDL
jgi:ribosomal protein S18 acetylase RimI-like enzyme